MKTECKFSYIHHFLSLLSYEHEYKKCELIVERLNQVNYLKSVLIIYIYFIKLLRFSPKMIELNKKFIFYKFISGIVILVFESDTSYDSKAKTINKKFKNQVFDTVVIGSGPGGAIAALRCLEKGEKVALIESGQAYLPGSISHHSLGQANLQFVNQGLSLAFGNMPLLYAEGGTYGGGSEVNSGLYFKLSGPYRDDFLNKCNLEEKEWSEKEKVVEKLISVQKSPKGTYVDIKSALISGSKKLDLTVEEIPRWRKYSPIEEHQSMQLTYLKKAERLGLEVLVNTEVLKINDKEDEIKIIAKSIESDPIIVKTNKIVLSAGTINTPKILKKSKLISGKVNFNFHPMTRCVVDYGEKVNHGDLFPSFQSWTSDYKYKFGYAVSSYPFVKATLASLGKYKDLVKLSNLVCYFSSTVLDNPWGRIVYVRNKPLPIIYIGRKDREKIRTGFSLLKRIMKNGGVKKIWPSEKLPSLTTVHIFGSLPLNSNKNIGGNGQLVKNSRIKICDSSLLPSAPWGNPQAVMMVLNEILIEKWLNSFE